MSWDPEEKMARIKAEKFKTAKGRRELGVEPQPQTYPVDTRGRPTAPPRKGRAKATCHPSRYAVADGLCQVCVVARAMPASQIGKPQALAPSQLAQRMDSLGETAYAKEIRRSLQARLPEYVELHLQATRLAAVRGDARPAEWALQTIKVGDGPIVAPVAAGAAGGTGGVKVIIGVNLGGLPAGTMTPDAVTLVEEKRDGAAVSGSTVDV